MSNPTMLRGLMILLQILSAGSSGLLFYRLFSDKYITFFGILLYLSCPYRIFVCFYSDGPSLSAAAAWALLPLYTLAAAELIQLRKANLFTRKRENVRDDSSAAKGAVWKKLLLPLVTAVLTLTMIGYLDIMLFFILCGLTLLGAFVFLAPFTALAPVLSALCCCKPLLAFLRYLFSAPKPLEALHSIMRTGYQLGEFFNLYAHEEGHPGMGAGLLLGIGILLWLTLAQGSLKLPESCRAALGYSLFLGLLSLKIFPWDFVQRLGLWALRLVSLLETPAIFFGLGCFFLCIPAAFALGSLCREMLASRQ